MKNLKIFKSGFYEKLNLLIIPMMLLSLGVGQMWANLYICGDGGLTGCNWCYYSDDSRFDNGARTFYAVAAGTYYFKVSDGSKLSTAQCISSTSGNITSYGKNNENAMYITVSEISDVTFTSTGSGWNVNISASTSSYFLKYPWGKDYAWTWSAPLTDFGGGKYGCTGPYNGTTYDYGRRGYDGGAGGATALTGATTVNSPSKGDKCVFELTYSTGALQITRCKKVNNGNHVYFDNSVSGFTGNLYLVIGHDKPTAFSKAYALTRVTGTNLYHVDLNSDTWDDATYYAVIGSSSTISSSDNSWGSSSLSTKGTGGYTAAYTGNYDLDGTSSSYKSFLITTASSGNNKTMSIGYYNGHANLPKVNATQGAKWRDTGTSYSITTGTWPATLKLRGSYMNDATDTARSTITSTASTDGSANKTYSVIKSGEVTHSYTSISSSYYFEGWGTGTTPSVTTASHTYTITSATTTYAFFSKKYALTFLPKGTYGTSTVTAEVTNYVSVSSGNSIPTGHSITVTATPATGYKLIDSQAWFSDAECTESLSNGTSTTYSISSLNAASGVYAKFEPISYSLSYELDGGNVESANPTNYNIESSAITLNNPTKTGYTFAGWTGTDLGGATTTVTIASGSTGDRSYTATWTEDMHDVTVNAQTGGTVSYNGGAASSSCTARAGIATASANIVATANAGYYFVGWQLPDGTITKASESAYNGSTSTYTINATADAKTVTALFNVRYALLGSQDADGEPTSGMPGWNEVNEAPFTYSDGTYTKSVSLTVPNVNYKFRVVDRRGTSHKSYGLASKAVIAADANFHDLYYDTDETTQDVQLATAGRGTYTLTVQTNGSGHPQVKITNQPSYQVHFGKAAFTIDGVNEGDLGGTVTVSDGTNTYADGKYIASGETVTVTASDVEGYTFVGWFANDSYSYEFGDKENPHSWTVSEAVNAYAKFVENTDTLKTTGNWNTTGNWSNGALPTIDDVVIIEKPVNVDITTAVAKRVVIYNDGSSHTGKLTVNAGKALVVAQTVKKTTDGLSYSATTAADLVLESDLSNGTGALITGERSTNTVATVQFATKAKKDGSGNYVNQYFGIPFAATTKYSYYGSYLRKFDVATDKWVSLGEDAMYPFTAYRIMREETTNETYVMDGVLRLPGTTTNKDTTLTLVASASTDNMFANSWTAPISIEAMETSDFTGATATVYIFNAGSSSDYSTNGASVGTNTILAGQWLSLPVAAVKENPGNYYQTVIPSQQAFLVQTTSGASHTLKLDYKKLVYDPAATSVDVQPTLAPKRTQETDLEIMRLNLAGDVSGFGDRVLMYMRDDFSAELDNGWEAYKLAGSDFAPQLCAYSQLGEMSISAIDDAEGTVLGFYAGTEDGNYTFSFGYEGDNVWYLNDHEAQKSALIDDSNTYQFTATPGTVAEHRFVISKAPIYTTPTGADEVVSGSKIRKQMINGTLYIIRDGRLYDVTGAFVK